MRIDSHQHFWALARGDYGWLTPDLAPLYRDFGPGDLKPLLDAAGLDGTIAVQAAPSEAETAYLLGLAGAHDWIRGVVGWVDLAADSAVASIDRLAAHPRLVGLRPMIQDLPDDSWMLSDALAPAIAAMVAQDLTFDALVTPRHLAALKCFLARYPELRVVIDHGAKPAISEGAFGGAFDRWAADMAEIAAGGAVFCKLSGLVTEAGEGWQAADLAPYIEHILRSFGPRVLFGSDWPVLRLAGDYAGWHAMAAEALAAAGYEIGALPVAAAYPRMGG